MEKDCWYWRLVTLLLVPTAVASCAASSPGSAQLELGEDALAHHDYAGAETYFKKALSLIGQDNRPTPELSKALTELSRCYTESAHFGDAEPLLRRVVTVYTSLYGHDSEQVAAALNALAACYFQQAKYVQAEPLCKEALAIQKKVLGPDHKNVASTCNNLAEIYQKQDKDDLAEPYFMAAVAVYQKMGPPGVPRMVETFNNLALFYNKQHRIDEARTTIAKALNLQKKLGKDNTGLAATLKTMAAIEKGQFNYDDSEREYKEAIAVLKKHESAARRELFCDILDDYADLLAQEGKIDEAEKVYVRAIQECEQARGKHHPCVAERLSDLAGLYRGQKRYGEAEALLKRALNIQQDAFESDSPAIFQSMNELSSVYVAEGKFALAEKLYQDALPELEKVLGADHPHVADTLENWANVATKAGRAKETSTLLDRAKKIRSKFTGAPVVPKDDKAPRILPPQVTKT